MILVPPLYGTSTYPRCISFVALAWHPVTGHAEHGTLRPRRTGSAGAQRHAVG